MSCSPVHALMVRAVSVISLGFAEWYVSNSVIPSMYVSRHFSVKNFPSLAGAKV